MLQRAIALGLLGVGMTLLGLDFPVGAQDQALPPPRAVSDAGANLELVEFRDLSLEEAMRLLSQQSGLRIVPSAAAAKVRVSLFLRDVPALTAVNAITQANGLVFRRDADGIIRVFTVAENQRDLSSFREEATKVFTLLYPNAVDAATAIRDLFGDRVQLSYGADDQMMIEDLQNRFDRFDLIDERSLGLGVSALSGIGGGGIGGIGGIGGGLGGLGGGGFGGGGFGGGGFGGGGFGGGGFGGGGLQRGRAGGNFSRPSDTTRAIREQQTQGELVEGRRTRLEGFTPEELQQIEDAAVGKEGADRSVILNILRRRPATIYVTIVQRNNQVIVRTSDPVTMQQICDLIQQIDVPTAVVLLEVKVLSIDLRDDFNSMFDFQFTDGALIAGGFSPGALPGSGFASGNILPPAADALSSAVRRFTTIAPGAIGAAPPTDFLFQLVSANFRYRLQLLENKNRVTELATPLVMTANNEVSTIFSGRQIPITVGFTPAQIVNDGTIGGSNTVASTPITQLAPIGTTLLITPNINADRTVTLRIIQENSRVIVNGARIPVPAADGSVVQQVPVDVVDSRKVSGTFVAKDGLAIAIGGLIEEGVSDTRAEVPVVGKIPYLGFFFRQQSTFRTRRELVFVIRPFVLTTPGESTEASKGLLDAISIHPNVRSGDFSNLGTYNAQEIVRPNPPETFLQNIFRVHTISPKDF